MSVVGIIPARMAATRFPDKPLAMISGIPMIIHCYHRALLASRIDEVVIATCDEVIAATGRDHGARVVMTSDMHLNAIDRSAEAAGVMRDDHGPGADVIVVIQGDEPLLVPSTLDLLADALESDPSIDVANVMVPFQSEGDFLDHNNPKVVIDERGFALYMSREPIPSPWQSWHPEASHMQTGLFAFRPDALQWFASTPRTVLEMAESIDMLRLLHGGKKVRMLVVDEPTIGVDTPDDLIRVQRAMLTDEFFPRYGAARE